mmetsp:Transcript_74921/g.148879  ORF Transcript_74921/g.148879 Transcript_74921/m.148879 type:complete len:184 (-) Transcript_74921:131-682(-)
MLGQGNISSSWGALSGEEMADRFWWGASLGVYVGHSETIERAGISDDAQPLWWAKGGELIGHSPARIKWFLSLWQDGSTARPTFGSLVPSQSYLDDVSKSALVANLMSATDGSYIFLHFLRPGRWTVPLWHTGTLAHAKWEVRAMDYWAMKVTVRATLSGNTSNAVIDVPAVPGNYEIVRVAS